MENNKKVVTTVTATKRNSYFHGSFTILTEINS